MSGSLTLALRTAQSGLLVNQSALDAVANNIANVNTESYSRKIVQMEQRVVAGAGAGVQLSDVVRNVDEGLLKSLRLELSTLNRVDVQTSYYDRTQDMFGAPGDNTSFAHVMTQFNNAIEDLSAAPDQLLSQSEMVRQGTELASILEHMSTSIQDLRLQADQEIARNVQRVNELGQNIVNLNNKIISNSAVNSDVTDLRDQRDAALNEMATLLDISYFTRSDGDVVVFTTGGRTLVDNSAASVTHDAASAVAPTTTYSEGDLQGIYVGAATSSNDITNEIRDGRIKGLIEQRDTILPGLQSQLDEYTAQLRDTINLIHNRGTTFPGSTELTGTRQFLDPATQTIQKATTADVRFVLTDSNGAQVANTTLESIMTGNGPWTINTVATNMQTWLTGQGVTGATVAVNSTTGKMEINLNSSTRYLSFRDEVKTAVGAAPLGSTAGDATISFDANGDGTVDETVNGFSNFFGLNDFFVDDLADNIRETDVMVANYSATSTTTLKFYDSGSTFPGTPMGSVAVTSGDSLDTIATNINNAAIGVTATVVADGSGERLRITHDKGANMEITETGGSFLSATGMHSANVRVTTQLHVRDDIVKTPGLITRGTVQWDSAQGIAGEYFTSRGDNSAAFAMAETMSSTQTFKEAGGIRSSSATFAGQAGNILSTSASKASSNQETYDFQTSLTNSLKAKSDSFRGVNLDEEMSQLMLFEQAYSAAARIVSTVQRMFDALENVI